MIGRAAWHAPWSLRTADGAFFGARDPMLGRTRRDLIDEYCDHAEAIHERYGDYKGGADAFGWPATVVLRPLLGLFHGERGSSRFKDVLCVKATTKGCCLRDVLDTALEEVPLYVIDAPAL
jgi:tRNA-dihydrouridine synthase